MLIKVYTKEKIAEIGLYPNRHFPEKIQKAYLEACKQEDLQREKEKAAYGRHQYRTK